MWNSYDDDMLQRDLSAVLMVQLSMPSRLIYIELLNSIIYSLNYRQKVKTKLF